MRLFIPALLITAAAAHAASVSKAALGTDVEESDCSIRRPTSRFRAVDPQVFVALNVAGVHSGESLRIDWVNPYGAVEQSAPYEQLPDAAALCFVNQLPISGFGASAMPGTWTIRMVSAGRQVWAQTFTLEGDGNNDQLRIVQVQRQQGKDKVQLRIDGAGFEGGSVVHIAVYERSGGWRYIHSLLPQLATANRITAQLPSLSPGEYLAIVRNSDGALSKPSRFVVSTDSGYHLPIGPGERWIVTQGPYGGFSHWRQSLHAYDIAPRAGRWVAAMRGGTAYTHDLKLRQTKNHRSFGNYITIQHENGEYSHYAHLASGTFLVKNGQRVEAGQPLARVGNSGYTLGEGGGYHVHVHVTREERVAAQSIPFRFEELREAATTKLRGLEVASTSTFSIPSGIGEQTNTKAKTLQGTVDVAGRWDTVLTVPARTKEMIAELRWGAKEGDLDLQLVSPSGHYFGWNGDTRGYTGQQANPEVFRIPNPEPGPWRILVEGMRGGSGGIPFEFGTTFAAADPPTPVRSARRRR